MSTTSDPKLSPAAMSSSAGVRHIDRELLQLLRDGQAKSIGELTELLGVTATAVRQRVDRLLDQGLIDREKIVAGRGRPTFRYLLTVDGYRAAGADTGLLAEAMWRSILDISDGAIRRQVVASIATRLGRQMKSPIDASLGGCCGGLDESELLRDDRSFADRMRLLSQVLRAREFPVQFGESSDLPVLDIEACPYPSLTDASDDRSMCRLEEQMLSEALGEPVQLSQCRLDGDACCQFSRVDRDAGSTDSEST